MAFVKVTLWTLCAVGLGIYLAKGKIDGRTPLDHLERTWDRTVNPSQLDRLKDGFGDAFESAKDAVSSKSEKQPRERISKSDREELNRLISNHK